MSALFIKRKNAIPRNILSRNKIIKKHNLSQENLAALILSYLTLVDALIRAINNILLGLRVILMRTLRTPLVPCFLTIIVIIAARRKSLITY
jgi:hypothetical protein